MFHSLFSRNLPKPIKTTLAFNNSHSICLTFDDGPDPEFTPEILDLLSNYGVKATFFVLGEAAEQHPHLVKKIMKAGHSIGNHTYTHRHPWVIPVEEVKHEIAYTNSIIKNITGNTPKWFRPPFGRLPGVMNKQVHHQKMTTVLWSHSIIDWGPLGTEAGISRRLAKIKQGDIVLMHDGKREHNHPDVILRCLPGFLRLMQDKGLKAYSLDDIYVSK